MIHIKLRQLLIPLSFWASLHFVAARHFLLQMRPRADPPDNNKVPLAMIQTMKKLKSGYISGTRVILGNLGDFINTSAITDLSFLGSQEDGYPDSKCSRNVPPKNPLLKLALNKFLLFFQN